MRLTAHPRLYASATDLQRLATPLPTGAPGTLRLAAKNVARMADEFVKSPRFDWVLNTHNAHLVRARRMQTRVFTLLTRWRQTGQKKYRDAVVAHIAEMGAWEYWSWITWRVNNPKPDAIFDLSYGENSATLAIAYDWLHDSLTAAEKKIFCACAKNWVFRSYLKLDKPKHKDWWFKKPDTNWNTVCAGGAGMVALAFADDFPREAAATLERTETSIRPYLQLLDQSHGGWPEGIGYWGYGMRYAWMYLLSWERATGKKHPQLKSPNVERTLEFPLDFLPNGEPCSFGDVNHYWILPFHYAAAKRYGRGDLARALDDLMARNPDKSIGVQQSWPNAADLLLFHPRTSGRPTPVQHDHLKAYTGLDWFVLADRWPNPALCLSIRGGTTEVPHGHMDLTSFHCVVGDEALIDTISADEYLDSTFSARRFELFEMTPPAKNAVLINGVGIGRPVQVVSKPVAVAGHRGVWMDAAEAMCKSRGDTPAASAYNRLFVLLGQHGAIVIDRLEFQHFARAEARIHSRANVTAKPARGRSATATTATALIRGKKQSLAIAYAATVPAVLQTARPALTTPGKFLNTLRWCSQGLHQGMTFAALLTPGKKPGKVALKETKSGLIVTIQIGQYKKTLQLKKTLRPA